MDDNRKNAPDYDSTGEIISWVITFILLVAFWPVGLFMLIKKIRGYGAKASPPARKTPVQGAPYTSQHTAQHFSTQPNQQQWKPAVQGTPTVFHQPVQPANKKANKKNRSPLEKKTGKFVSTMLLLISIVLFFAGATGIANAVGDILGSGIIRWSDLLLGVFFLAGGFVSFFSRNIGVKRLGKYKKYFAFVAGRGIVPISDIARSAGIPVKTVKRDIQTMINNGHFGPAAYIDSELDSLVLVAEAAKEARRAKYAAQSQPSQAEKPENQYMAIIVELRELNDTIADISISEKIDRIEVLTAKIFRIVEENPSKLPQIRRFMNYYLPTTLKLLHSYALLEKQGIKGENITAAKESIGRILDTLATGFEQQLDQLFQSDVIDIAADIDVLENMMHQDGLTSDKPEFQTMESAF